MIVLNVTYVPYFKSLKLMSPRKCDLTSDIATLEKCGWFIKKKVTYQHKDSVFGKMEDFIFVGENSLKNKCGLFNSFAQCNTCIK